MARRSLTVNAVGPGFVHTELGEGGGDEVLHALPPRQPGMPKEVAACGRYAVSAEPLARTERLTTTTADRPPERTY